MKRRLLASSAALLALAACTALPGTAPTISPTVQAVFNATQFLLPLLDVLAAGIAVAVPAAAPIVAIVAPYLASASGVFQTLQVVMTETQAQPLVQQIEGDVQAAVAAIAGVVNGNPKLAPLASKIAQAQAVLGLLTAFVNGVQAMPRFAERPVALPLLHR